MNAPADLVPRRPALRWHGGKWRLAPWILQHLPPHRVYVEPFGGAASVLLRKPRAYAEVYNDLDDEVVTLFRVLRDPGQAAELQRLLELTPFARAEFDDSYGPSNDPIETARRLVVRSYMGFGSNAHATTGTHRAQTGFRANSTRSGTTPALDWKNYPAEIGQIVQRLRGVVIEHRPAIEVLRAHDGPLTLHYVDPPYLHGTRSLGNTHCRKKFYRHEMTDADHAALLAWLRQATGMVVLSGYPSELYDSTLPDWRRVETVAQADGARKRVEVLWINPQACAAMDAQQGSLFGAGT